MYTRQVKECPESFVRQGKPVFGTFSGHPKRLDIRGVKSPYAIVPLPVFITNLRIKSRLSYFFTLGEYTGCVEFFDAKVFGFAEICFWNMVTKQRFVYRSVMGPRKRFVPHNLDVAITANYNKRRYTRISWDRAHNKLSVLFNLRGNSVRPGSNGALLASFDSPQAGELTAVMPAPTIRRCSAHYITVLPLHGAVTLFDRQSPQTQLKTMPDTEGTAFLDISRTYMKFRTHGEFVTGFGLVNGCQIGFRLQVTSQDAVESEAYNTNVLFYNGKATPLPPVRITHPYGTMKKWIIQDTENMVDLEFTPVSENPNVVSAFILRSEYHTIYGTFEGTLLTAEKEKVSFRTLPGISKKYLIRL